MAIFRKGVKVGKFDIRTGVTKKRAQGLLRKAGIIEDDKGREKYKKDARGNITEQLIPSNLATVKRQAGISLNTSDIIRCIGDKVKDLFGIFTVSLGIPTFDMFKVPDFAGISNNIADSFDDMFESVILFYYIIQ